MDVDRAVIAIIAVCRYGSGFDTEVHCRGNVPTFLSVFAVCGRLPQVSGRVSYRPVHLRICVSVALLLSTDLCAMHAWLEPA